MAFKSVNQYNEERFGKMFTLRNDGDFADVVFLYQSVNDVLVADTHYIKSADYSGYVHCCGRGCPACSKGIRVQTKLFIPLYNVQRQEVEFWDRTMRFEPQLQNDVFSRYPNPSEFVFRITRHGAANDINTTYEIQAIGKNTSMSFAKICADGNFTFPEYYSTVCKEATTAELHQMLNSGADNATSYGSMPEYSATPRVAVPNVSSFNVEPPVPTNSSVPQYQPASEAVEASDSLGVPDSSSDFADISDDDIDF